MSPLTYAIVALSILPLALICRWLHPRTAIWISVLVVLGSLMLAVGSFWLFQWLQLPVLAYVDAIMYAFITCWAALNAVNRWLIPSDEQQRSSEKRDIVNT
jgi:hypothetical protein